MRLLKKLGLVFLAFVAMVLVIALFLPNTFEIQREADINRSPDKVFVRVADLEKWALWDPWTDEDKNAVFTYTGEAASIGQTRSWKGEKIGEGSMRLKAIVPSKKISSLIVLKTPGKQIADDVWSFDETESGTHVTWSNTGNLSYPFGRLYGLMMDKILGDQLQKGLDSLKVLVENDIDMPPQPLSEPELYAPE